MKKRDLAPHGENPVSTGAKAEKKSARIRNWIPGTLICDSNFLYPLAQQLIPEYMIGRVTYFFHHGVLSYDFSYHERIM